MKFQEQPMTYPYANTPMLPKQSFTSNENFNTKLPRFIKQISLKQNLSQQNLNQAYNTPQIHSIKFDTQKNIIRSNVSTILETESKMYLFLVRSVVLGYSELVLFEYIKQNGERRSMEFSGIKGEITCIKAKFCKRIKVTNNNSQLSNNKSQRKGQSSSKSNPNQLQVTLFLGTTTGYFKILRFSKNLQVQNYKDSNNNNPTIQNQLCIQSLQLQKSQIAFIHILDPEYYHNANLSLVQTLSNKVYLINFDIMETLSIFYPTIISCQIGLSLSVNDVGKYFIQCTEGGYIIFWEFNENVIKVIKRSTQIKDDKERQNQNCQGIINQEKQFVRNQNIQNRSKNPKNYSNFQSKNLVHCINPLKIFHSATIYGLKFCQLYGNLILLITQQGLFKILAVNNSSINTLNDNQYCSLLENKIDHGELIIDAKFFPKTKEVFIVKSELYKSINKQNSQEIPLKPFRIDSLAANSTKKIPKPYQPNLLKTIRNNSHLDQLPSPSILSQPNTKPISKLIPLNNPPSSSVCYFQRIIFNSELQIQRIDKIYPSHQITAIQSLQIVQQKDIFILRGKQFYLAGVMDNFVEDR